MKQHKMPEPLKVYEILLKYFGNQRWWPVIDANKKSSEQKKFEICIGAVLTQNTSWANVEKAILKLNNADILNCQKIKDIKQSHLADLIRSSGYYNQKAERLKKFAEYIYIKYQGRLEIFFNRETSVIRDELLSLSGIGPETADSMLLYAGKKLTFVVDAYTYRLGEKIGWFNEKKYDTIQKFFTDNLPYSLEVYNEYHALIVALSKEFCRKKPICLACPLIKVCLYYINSKERH